MVSVEITLRACIFHILMERSDAMDEVIVSIAFTEKFIPTWPGVKGSGLLGDIMDMFTRLGAEKTTTVM